MHTPLLLNVPDDRDLDRVSRKESLCKIFVSNVPLLSTYHLLPSIKRMKQNEKGKKWCSIKNLFEQVIKKVRTNLLTKLTHIRND